MYFELWPIYVFVYLLEQDTIAKLPKERLILGSISLRSTVYDAIYIVKYNSSIVCIN